jgi:hypothetical protein
MSVAKKQFLNIKLSISRYWIISRDYLKSSFTSWESQLGCFFFNLTTKLGLESRLRTHHSSKSPRLKQLICDRLSVSCIHKRLFDAKFKKKTPVIQGGPTLTIFAITRFLIIEKILRLARKRHRLWSYKPVPLFYLLSIGFRVKRR